MIRIDRREVGAGLSALVRISVMARIVVLRHERDLIVLPEDSLAVVGLFDSTNLIEQLRRPTGEIDQQTIESVSPLKFDQRLRKAFAGEPDLMCGNVRIEE